MVGGALGGGHPDHIQTIIIRFVPTTAVTSIAFNTHTSFWFLEQNYSE